MKPAIPIFLVGICLLLVVGAAVWWFHRKGKKVIETDNPEEVALDANFWRDFPAAKATPVPVPYGPYFPLEAKGIDKVVAFDDVLSESEMAYLRALMGSTKRGVLKGSNPWLKSLQSRIAKLLQKDPSSLEALRLIKQDAKDEVSPHIDVLEDGGGRRGQRLSTLQVFLNVLPPLEDGGRIIFNKLDAALKPKAGTAIAWNNVLLGGSSSGSTDHEMWHMSQALTLGGSTKYILVAYSRERA